MVMVAGDKFTINEGQPYMLPHSCVSCNTNKNTQYIDWGISVPKYGRLYFCIDCFAECAKALDYLSPYEAHEVLVENVRKDNEIRSLKDENAKLRNLVISSIPSLRNDLVDLQFKQPEVVPTPRRSSGRPKSAEPRVTQ
jgi:hypothetical protein